mgnify:CR=1 FL=1
MAARPAEARATKPTTIIREKNRRYVPSGHWVLFASDTLLLQCDAHALARIVADAKLELLHDKELPESQARDEAKAVLRKAAECIAK